MTVVALSVDRVIVETDAERNAAERIPAILKQAFFLLAERWSRTPWARTVPLDRAVRRALETEPVTADDLFGPRGAELLADRLWRAFVAHVVGGA